MSPQSSRLGVVLVKLVRDFETDPQPSFLSTVNSAQVDVVFVGLAFLPIPQQVKPGKHLVCAGTRRAERGMVSGAGQLVFWARSKHDQTVTVGEDGTAHLKLDDVDLHALQALQATPRQSRCRSACCSSR